MRANLLAWLSLVLGILAPLTCGATGPFAVLFGYLALRQANLSDGQVRGARPAWAGMALGALGIVLFLGGLFVVGLTQMRDKSDLAVCTNNLRRIGMAVNLYADQKDHPHFPPGTIGERDLAPEERLSWTVAVLPYMEVEPGLGPATGKSPAVFQKGQALLARFDLTMGWQAEANRQAMTGVPTWFICPAAPGRPNPGEPAWTHYVGLAGLGADAATLPTTDPNAGFFGYDRVITRDDIQRGTAQTMLVTERLNAVGPWGAGGPATVTGVDPNRQPYVPSQFGGLHRDGANTLFVDGHVRAFTDRAERSLWEDQCRINVDQ